MKINYATLLIVLSALFIASCSTWDKLNNREKGAVIGVGSGAAVGSAVGGGTGAVVGGLGGGVAGGVIGNEMDKDERDD